MAVLGHQGDQPTGSDYWSKYKADEKNGDLILFSSDTYQSYRQEEFHICLQKLSCQHPPPLCSMQQPRSNRPSSYTDKLLLSTRTRRKR